MKKYIIAAVTFAAFYGLSFAQQTTPAANIPSETPKMEAPKAAPKAAAKKEMKKEAAKMETVAGDITAIDTVANTFTVKDEKGMDKVITVDAKKIATLKVGEKVTVKMKDSKVVSVKPVREHKGKKPEMKK